MASDQWQPFRGEAWPLLINPALIGGLVEILLHVTLPNLSPVVWSVLVMIFITIKISIHMRG